MKFFDRFVKLTATVYMRSGNVIVMTPLKSIEVEMSGPQVNGIKWDYYGGKVILLNLNVDEIEGIIVTKKLRFW